MKGRLESSTQKEELGQDLESRKLDQNFRQEETL